METNNWIEKILNSTNGMTQVFPSDDLFSKIQQRVNLQNRVSPKTVWLVAASIAVLVMINITVLKTKTKDKAQTSTSYLESTLNQNNQLY